MSLVDKIHLRKALRLAYGSESLVNKVIREDIRTSLKKKDEDGDEEGGADFHVPFWSDAKNHVFGRSDLILATEQRVLKNPRSRKRLYPLLMEGFLKWLDDEKRVTNHGIEATRQNIKGSFHVNDYDVYIKVQNLLALKIGDEKRVIYPYFFEETVVTPEAARMGLWVMSESLQEININDLRILDVIRSKSYSVKDVPFQGNEKRIFNKYVQRILDKREDLLADYEHLL